MRTGGASSKNIRNSIIQNLECYKAFKVNDIRISVFYFFLRIVPKFFQFFEK